MLVALPNRRAFHRLPVALSVKIYVVPACALHLCRVGFQQRVLAKLRRILQQTGDISLRSSPLFVREFFHFIVVNCVSLNEYQKKPNFCEGLMSFLSVLIFFYFSRYQLHDTIIGFRLQQVMNAFFFSWRRMREVSSTDFNAKKTMEKKSDSKNGNPIV